MTTVRRNRKQRTSKRAARSSTNWLELEHRGRKLRLQGDPPSISYNQWNPLTLIGSVTTGGTAAPVSLASADVLTGIQAQIGFTVTGTLEFRLLQARVYNRTGESSGAQSDKEIRVVLFDPDNSNVVLADLYDLSNLVELAGVGFVYPRSRSAQPFSATDVFTIASSSNQSFITYLYILWRVSSTVAPATSGAFEWRSG